jgi:hypothetical protein
MAPTRSAGTGFGTAVTLVLCPYANRHLFAFDLEDAGTHVTWHVSVDLLPSAFSGCWPIPYRCWLLGLLAGGGQPVAGGPHTCAGQAGGGLLPSQAESQRGSAAAAAAH